VGEGLEEVATPDRGKAMNAPSTSRTGSESRLVKILDDFLAAVHRGDPPNRATLLAAHPDLAEELETCLASLDFISCAAASASDVSQDLTFEPKPHAGRLGDFRILREAGRGGMGVVYEAEQLSLHRRVALKVLPFASALDSRQLQRFRLEAQAAAQLHHSNIVPVYSVGVERGVHYYAMQFIDGRTIAEVIDELRQLNGPEKSPRLRSDQTTTALAEAQQPTRPESPTSPLTPGTSNRGRSFFEAVARLGIQAAESLEYAHSLGVVHRDVKPANLMVDDRGHLWITDFGLAQLNAESGPTMTGDLLGTLRYMSPEQALGRRGVVDHRADVYSLGVTLYELLTLRPALDGRDRQELLRQIAFEEPPPPRHITPSIPRELETIILKAIAREPEARYATAQELADDLRRFLEHKPIRARRPTLAERVSKWARRHAMAVWAAALVLLIGSIGLTVGLVLLGAKQAEVTRQRDEIKRVLKDTEVAREQAEEVSRLLVESFRRPDPDQDGRELKVVDLLTSAAAKLDTEFAGSPKVKGDLLKVLGTTFSGLGLRAQAVEILEKVQAIRQATLGPDHPDTLSSRNHLAESYLLAERSFEALTLCKSTFKLMELRLGPDHPETLSCGNNLGMAYAKMGRTREAIALLESTLKLKKSTLGPEHLDTLTTMSNLGSALSDAGRINEALPLFKSVLELRESRLGPDHPHTLQGRNNLAFALTGAGRCAEAIPLIEATLKQRELRLGPDHPNTINSRQNLAAAYFKAGQLDRSLPLFELVLKQRTAKPGPDNPSTILAHANLGTIYLKTGHAEDGVRLLEEAIRSARGRPDAKKILETVLSDLANFYQASGQFVRVEPLYRELLARARESFGAEDPRTVAELGLLNLSLLKQQKWSEAEPIGREFLTALEKKWPDAGGTFIARSQLGDSLLGQGRFDEAEPLIVSGYEGLKAREETIRPEARPRLAETAERVVRLYEQWGRPDKAAAWKARLGIANLDSMMPNGAAVFAH
jgi:eukaryotic-like serine/threonine-protein kinase